MFSLESEEEHIRAPADETSGGHGSNVVSRISSLSSSLQDAVTSYVLGGDNSAPECPCATQMALLESHAPVEGIDLRSGFMRAEDKSYSVLKSCRLVAFNSQKRISHLGMGDVLRLDLEMGDVLRFLHDRSLHVKLSAGRASPEADPILRARLYRKPELGTVVTGTFILETNSQNWKSSFFRKPIQNLDTSHVSH